MKRLNLTLDDICSEEPAGSCYADVPDRRGTATVTWYRTPLWRSETNNNEV